MVNLGRLRRSVSEPDEAHLFARYLLPGVPIDGAAIERYRDGCRTLFAGPQTSHDLAVVGFVRRHPWALPFLDAAAACLHPRALLRRKLLLMLALLETTTTHAEAFTPTPRGRILVVLQLLWWTGRAGCQAVIGLLLWPLARSRR